MESEPPYQYVGGNPVNRVDPSGYCWWLSGEDYEECVIRTAETAWWYQENVNGTIESCLWKDPTKCIVTAAEITWWYDENVNQPIEDYAEDFIIQATIGTAKAAWQYQENVNHTIEDCVAQGIEELGIVESAPLHDTCRNVYGFLPSNYKNVVDAAVDSHAQKDDGVIFGFSGDVSSLIVMPSFSLLVPPHFVSFGECNLPQSGPVAGIEIVYDFKHLERGIFLYAGSLFNVGTFVNAGGTAYLGKTRGFAGKGVTYNEGVSAYSGYFANATLNVSSPGPGFGGAVIEAVPLESDKSINPTGVYATYYGVSVGFTGGLPNVDVAVTDYKLLHREQYEFLTNANNKKKDVGERKRVASFIAKELRFSHFDPVTIMFLQPVIVELWDYANDISE